MEIVVLVKQVPATDQVKIDPERGTMIRENIESELNPLDLFAVEEAVRLKERLDGEANINVLSMGPAKAVKTVRDALARGCDQGWLLSDRKFAGADTWSTSFTLASAIEKLVPGCDLILCGERATDGDTGQVGPMVATFLGLPVLSFVSAVERLDQGALAARREVEGGSELVQCPLPALLSVVKAINHPRLPNLAGKRRAKAAEVPVVTAEQLELPVEKLGLKGSPTRVVKVSKSQLSRQGRILNLEDDPTAAVEALVAFFTSPPSAPEA
ncbi:MAG: electron transfer flavoprotein subunit beta/FixA family protein [Desulfarculaceae bacterium]|nr:electron transfer flavoprotein subunit beta/FixA family protein [Desulfarculaceae bacterium]MCF8071573.1 electron transfer flavoprotein subunit beta/FixA family protein [Desulfarculaceae bacterium]MCF8102388.1 electron transfer flavoprotein subunit beta/FixA family protein [Desulfarculaceae bacterium]MCF8114852.1 electron transfer flavoprotein subunit beta/FixA family protein [Desulfarculaceae bacterium]